MARRSVLPTSQRQGSHFEQLHVQKVYDEIASTVNDIQHKAWPNVKRFIKKLPPGSLIADIGCGNGRYLNVNKKLVKVGIDVCQPLVNRARVKGYEVAYGDNLQVPFRDGMFDGVVSIGVIHHFSSHERRVQALKELARILQPGGKLMVYVWAYEQKHRKFECQDVLVPWHEGLKEIRRTGSTSSRHSSIGGMSSTSSVSEDDSIDQSIGPNRDNNSPLVLRRKSSMSLEDLTMLKEQRDFKTSYYSLEFTGESPVHRRTTDLRRLSATSRSSRGHKESVISECRKLEASLRAMSTGNLEEMRKKALTSEDIDDTNAEQVFDLSGVNMDEYERNLVSGKDGEVFEVFGDVDENINDIPGSAEELQAIVNKLSEKGKCLNGDNKAYERRKRMCGKVNPFMKQDSLDPYTFNDVQIPKSEKDSLNELTKVSEVTDTEMEAQDEVFVNFKPGKPDVVVKPSLFTSIKTRFLSMFDNDNDVRRKKKDTNSKSFDATGEKDSSLLDIMPRSISRPEFTMEQINMASLLKFKVREFPLSSCPEKSHQEGELVTQDKTMPKNGKVIAKNNNECSLTSAHPIFSEQTSHHGKNQNQLVKQLSSESDHLNLAKAFLKSEVVTDEYVEVIYDGYIKIDLDKLQDEPSALKIESNNKTTVCNSDNKQNGEVLDVSGQSVLNGTFNDRNNHLNNGKLAEFSEQVNDRTSVSEQSIDERTDDVYEEDMESDTIYTQGLSEEREALQMSGDLPSIEDTPSSKLCRYYHVFQEGELGELIAKHVPDLQIVQCFYDHANWCVIAEKVSH